MNEPLITSIKFGFYCNLLEVNLRYTHHICLKRRQIAWHKMGARELEKKVPHS